MTNLKPIKALTNFLRENKKEGMTMAEIGVFDGSTTRDYIDLIRENNGKRSHFTIDLTNKNFIGSEAYYVKQNDVIIVSLLI